MSEVSSWNETDNSNTAAPPDGWPEFMNPSDVNNCARMMMGAIKRWYNTVSAGIANALPLSGGTLTGPLVAPGITSTLDITGRSLYLSGGANVPNGVTTTDIHATGNVLVDGALSAWNGVNTNELHVTDGVVIDGALNVANGITTNNIHATNTLTVDGSLTAGVTNTANLTVTGNEGITGNLTVAGFVNAGYYSLSGGTFAIRGSDAAGAFNAVYDAANGVALALYGPNGSYYRCDNAHSFTNRAATVNIVRFQVTDGVCQNASGAWSTLSDAALKENIEPYRSGLAEVLKLEPRSFTYTRDAPLGAGSRRIGLVAQEVAAALPEIVGETTINEQTYATIEPGLLVFALVNSIKALEARLTQLEAGG